MSRRMGMVGCRCWLGAPAGFVAALQFVDGGLVQGWDLLCALDAQRFALGGAPARQALFHFGFVALIRGRVKISAEHIFGQVLLWSKVLRLVMGIDITLAVTEGFGVAALVFERVGHLHQAIGFDLL